MTQQIRLKLPPGAIDSVVWLNVRLNEHTLIRMLLDTGAKYTIITPDVARRLALDTTTSRRVPVTTATQIEIATLIAIETIDVHGFALNDIDAVILDLPPTLGVDGLLGMSFLKRCRMVLDAPNRTLELVA